VEPKVVLRCLVRIQELALASREAQAVVDAAPARIEEIEARFRERNAEYVALHERSDALEHDQRERGGELSMLEEHRAKYTSDLMEVKNQREYSAMLKEIDSVKSQIAGHEDAILKGMETLEQLRGELATHAEHILAERELVQRSRAEVEAEADAARVKIQEISAERTRIQSELPDPLVVSITGLEARRQGMFLSRADNGTCQACFVRVRPQKFQEIRQAIAVHTCDNCRRYLYHPPALVEDAAGNSSPTAAPRSGVEAVNGGAV